jgi:hypothetical protein
VRFAGLILLPLIFGLAGMTAYAIRLRRPTVEVRERRRRLDLSAKGRMTGGVVIDLSDDQLYFSYSVGGVEYTAAQDISAIRDRLPANTAELIGPATVKYMPANPADSIVVSEEWNGLRVRPLRGAREERNLS